MNINRALLLSALDTCKPALATATNRAVELSHFWLDGDFISAYNGRLGIVYPFDSEIKGGVPATLQAWLEKTTGDNADLTTKGKELVIKVGASHATFAMLEAEKQILQPSVDLIDGEGVELDEALITGLKNILVSLDPKSATPARMGAFLVPNNEHLDIYATDDNSLSWLRVSLPKNYHLTQHIVVPTGFIEQVLKILPEGGRDALFVHQHAVVAVNNHGVMIIGNLIDCPMMPDFASTMSPYQQQHNNDVTVPEVLSGALDRVMLIPNNATEFAIENNILYVISNKNTTHFEEAMTFNHPNVIEFFDPELIYRALSGRTSMRIDRGSLCLKGPVGFIHLIAATQR
jgi:hypothetical protein